MKEKEFIFLGKQVNDRWLKGLMTLIGIVLFIGTIPCTPVLLVIHGILRLMGMKGIYCHSGHFINLTPAMTEPIGQ